MRLISVCGDTLFKSSYITIKESVEEAVSEGASLHNINLRGAKLSGARLDMAKMNHACLWGADLTGADMSDGLFKGADFRTAILKDTCLADSDCGGANFHGAYFSRTILNGTHLSQSKFSCPSLFSCDLSHVQTLRGAVFCHQGEIDCPMDHPPIVIHGLHQPIVIMGHDLLIGTQRLSKDCFGVAQKTIIHEITKSLCNHKV
ncbi:MAG: pentapeptide repeat-containing protein [Alphaproteobacteria bacterium]|nr:pentapeptide repeat-containing protein [Alphaproteobacteria bacterium]NCQ88949.1 pentapeptide repeat-containing protein [Alphaproteobacteria bacterium]NCT07851.1 pentapeptide repeat-containing protein [Alphaproteobacteria bacterium]